MIYLGNNTEIEKRIDMFKILKADEAMTLIKDGDVIAFNSFLGIDNPVELHEALYERYIGDKGTN